MLRRLVVVTIWYCLFGDAVSQGCFDKNIHCRNWASNPHTCRINEFVFRECTRSCNACPARTPRRYDPAFLPQSVRRLGFLLGKWRCDEDGKARFPGMPVFTYGEDLEFTVGDSVHPVINYTAFAWAFNTKEELHGEIGYISVQNHRVSLQTVMNNGFATTEEGFIQGNTIRTSLSSIGRVSFGRDLTVTGLTRSFTVDPRRHEMVQVLSMETIMAPLQEHTRAKYRKIFP